MGRKPCLVATDPVPDDQPFLPFRLKRQDLVWKRPAVAVCVDHVTKVLWLLNAALLCCSPNALAGEFKSESIGKIAYVVWIGG